MDDALIQNGGIDSIVGDLDRCWEVTKDQDKASKIEKALLEIQRDVKTETTFMRGAEQTQFSTAGKCSGYATASSGQVPRNTTRRKTSRKQLR